MELPLQLRVLPRTDLSRGRGNAASSAMGQGWPCGWHGTILHNNSERNLPWGVTASGTEINPRKDTRAEDQIRSDEQKRTPKFSLMEISCGARKQQSQQLKILNCKTLKISFLVLFHKAVTCFQIRYFINKNTTVSEAKHDFKLILYILLCRKCHIKLQSPYAVNPEWLLTTIKNVWCQSVMSLAILQPPAH